MTQWRPDQTFHPSPRLAMQAPPERLAYVALAASMEGRPDAIGVVDVDQSSKRRGQQVGEVAMEEAGDGLRHLGWNACSSSLALGHGVPAVERRYLVAPGTRSSRLHLIDVRQDARRPTVAKVIASRDLCRRTGYSRPVVARPGPGGIFVSALAASHDKGPGGIFVIDPWTLDVRGRWEIDRGDQQLAHDFGWNLGYDTVLTGGWGVPSLIDGGFDMPALAAGRYGHVLHVWGLGSRRHLQTLDLGIDHQMVTSVRPAHDPSRAYGFAVSACSRVDLSASVWLWHRQASDDHRSELALRRIIDIAGEPAATADLPPVLQDSRVVPPLATSLALSLDDRFLYVSCWGTGQLRQYDVCDPFNPVLTGTLRLGGIVRRQPHPGHPGVLLTGGPQAVTVSQDGRRLYVTNALHPAWHRQFYPDGLRGWMVRAEACANGGLALDPGGFLDLGDREPCDVRLDGGDASSDSFCYA
jgi:selenium-binding protein 1